MKRPSSTVCVAARTSRSRRRWRGVSMSKSGIAMTMGGVSGGDHVPVRRSASLSRPMVLSGSPGRLRGAVIGLGMIGRHHARLLQSSDRVEFVGAVDPGGDRYRSVHVPELVFDTVEDVLARGGLDFAIVSVPTESHVAVAEQLAAAGVGMLIEKPLAATSDAARRIVELCEAAGVVGCVGHVERFNPALREMRGRLLDGQIGRLFTV